MQKFKIILSVLASLLALFVLDALYLKYVAKNPAGEQWKNGIYGTVSIGPQCPVVKAGEEDKCKDQPYQAVISVKTEDGSKEIDRFSSYSDGTFRLGLEPGNYLLAPLSPRGSILPRGTPQTVTIKAGKFTEVMIKYDSGIR